MRMVPVVCRATIGNVGNVDHNLIKIGKAGRKRHMGIRPTVRGSVMNPNNLYGFYYSGRIAERFFRLKLRFS